MIPITAVCPDGCGLTATMDPVFHSNLTLLELTLDTELFLTSTVRCQVHNLAVGGSAKSQHLPSAGGMCRAADVVDLAGKYTPEQIALAAQRLGVFGGIGLYKRHVHLDNRKGSVARWPREYWECINE